MVEHFGWESITQDKKTTISRHIITNFNPFKQKMLGRNDSVSDHIFDELLPDFAFRPSPCAKGAPDFYSKWGQVPHCLVWAAHLALLQVQEQLHVVPLLERLGTDPGWRWAEALIWGPWGLAWAGPYQSGWVSHLQQLYGIIRKISVSKKTRKFEEKLKKREKKQK